MKGDDVLRSGLMFLRHSNLRAAMALLVAFSVAMGGSGLAVCAAGPCADSQSASPTSKCCGPRCSCLDADHGVLTCCCSKRDKEPAPSPISASIKSRVELTWIPWAIPLATSTFWFAFIHAEEAGSASSLIARSVQSVLCIWRI